MAQIKTYLCPLGSYPDHHSHVRQVYRIDHGSYYHRSMTHHFEAPLVVPTLAVRPEWIDYNGHMNVAYYIAAFDQGVDHFLHAIDLGEKSVAEGGSSSFTLEIHINYLREVHEADPLRITVQLLDFDKKRFHYYMEMHHAEENYLAATCEQIGIHVDLATRRTASMPNATRDRLQAMLDSHSTLPTPTNIGKAIGIRRRKPT